MKHDDPRYDFWFWVSLMALIASATLLVGTALR